MKDLTKTCLLFALAVTGLCLSLSFAVEPATAATGQDRCVEELTRLANENQQLSLELMRAQAKLDALRSASARPDAVAILGGLGWIVGIFGGMAWFKTRKKN